MKLDNILSVLIIVVYDVCLTHGEIFSSVEDLCVLVRKEKELLPLMDKYKIKDIDAQRDVNSIYALFRLRHEASQNGSLLYPAEHPIDALLTIKLWLRLKQIYVQHDTGILGKFLEEGMNGFTWPQLEDYEGAVKGILRLQTVYSLSVNDLLSGVVSGQSAISRLETDDMLELGKAALDQTDHALAAQWLYAAATTEPSDLNLGPTVEEIQKHIQRVWIEDGDFGGFADTANDLVSGEFTFRPKPENVHKDVYHEVCRGDYLANDIFIDKRLHCRYKRGSIIPYAVYREEIHSIDPYISIFLNVTNEEESKWIRQAAFPDMYRGVVGDGKGNFNPDDMRVSKVGWLFSQHEILQKVLFRVEDITGLDPSNADQHACAEALQVVNYGVGGQYEPHFDFHNDASLTLNPPKELVDSGNRIATFIFYLTNTIAGGATVFPKIRVKVPAIQYAAALWYNLRASGDKDFYTRHAGCPVLLGQKWVANKWFRETCQFARRPCPLDPNDEPFLHLS